jgi:hypothetical protein
MGQARIGRIVRQKYRSFLHSPRGEQPLPKFVCSDRAIWQEKEKLPTVYFCYFRY